MPGNSELTPLQRSVLAIRELRSRLDRAERATTEPIAIVGLGCRFPGNADDPERFWALLDEARDAIVDVPPERWSANGPRGGGDEGSHLRRGGFLHTVDMFDARYFGITPREAAFMDPQQRLVLEIAIEALENAALAPSRLRGSRTAVFVGAMTNDYTEVVRDTGALDVHTVTGLGNCVIAGRVAYVLGLHGPTMTIDTACSSSLVAVHLACQSLRLEECDLALAGGVNLILTQTLSRAEDKAHMLSRNARCRTFDGAADGIVRGEGCGLVVLKRLCDAVADGDRIVAVIRGSAVNHDGASAGLTVPSQTAQEMVIREALARARVAPEMIDYVEAHGTGTSLGDPIEIAALAATVVGTRPSGAPLLVGSVKTNLGHLEAASGIAGLMKLVLSLEHESIPPHLHFRTPSPHIDWEGTPIRVPKTSTAWPRNGRERFGGVSSFSLSGTNAHIVAGDDPTPRPVPAPPTHDRTVHVLPLSAKSEPALRALAHSYGEYFASHPDVSLADVCFTAGIGRDHHGKRLALLGDGVDAMRVALASFAQGECPAGIVSNCTNDDVLPSAQVPRAPDSVRADLAALRGTGEREQVLRRLAGRYVGGADVDWRELDAGRGRRKLALPTYPFERQRHWVSAGTGNSPAGLASTTGTRTPATDLVVSDPLTPAVAFVQGLSVEQTKLLLAQPPEALAGLSADKLALLARLVGAPAAPSTVPAAGMTRYYDAMAGLESVHRQALLEDPASERYLTFAPLDQPIPGFSWLLAMLQSSPPHAHWQMCVDAQREMREVLFRSVGMQRRTRVLDIGCGYASDLVRLAQRYPHLRLDGYTLSAGQAESGVRRVEALGLSDRIRVFNRDSARDAFPERYDLVFGFEVAHHVRDKLALFANVSRHLNDDGHVLLADFVSTASFALDHDETSSYIVRAETWSEVLAHHRLRVVDAIDVSREVANFLHDSDFARHLDGLGGGEEFKDARNAAVSYDRLGKLLASGLVRYVLLAARHEEHLSTERTMRRNLEVLGAPRSYAEAVSDAAWHEIEWRNAPELPDDALPGGPGVWLVFAGEGPGVGAGVAESLRAGGEQTVLVHPGARFMRRDEGAYTVAPGAADDYRALLADVIAHGAKIRGVLHLWMADQDAADATSPSRLVSGQESGAISVMYLVQAFQHHGIHALTRLGLVTRATQSVSLADTSIDLRGAPLWAFGGSLANEHPGLQVRRLDLPGHATSDEVQAILRWVSRRDGEAQVALRNAGLHVPRLTQKHGNRASGRGPPSLSPDAGYLITGGTGALGIVTARWMIARGARRIFLTARDPKETEAVAALRQPGAEVTLLEADAADEESMRRAIAAIAAAGIALKGVVHAAGVIDDGIVLQLTPARLASVMRPKVDGAWNLHSLTLTSDLDFFVLYSSIASVFGPPTQSAYAAANGFMDALARHRRVHNLPGTSINWGPWGNEGMFARMSGRERDRSRTLGISPFSSDRALRLLGRALHADAPAQIVACTLDPLTCARHPAFAATASLLSDLDPSAAAHAASEQANTSPTHAAGFAMAGPPPGPLIDYLREMFAKVMGLEVEAMDVDSSLVNLGLDSLMAVELRQEVNVHLGVDLDLGQVLHGASLKDLSVLLGQEVERRKGASAVPASPGARAEPIPSPAAAASIDALAARQLLGSVDELSQEERDRLLSRMLEEERHAG